MCCYVLVIIIVKSQTKHYNTVSNNSSLIYHIISFMDLTQYQYYKMVITTILVYKHLYIPNFLLHSYKTVIYSLMTAV